MKKARFSSISVRVWNDAISRCLGAIRSDVIRVMFPTLRIVIIGITSGVDLEIAVVENTVV